MNCSSQCETEQSLRCDVASWMYLWSMISFFHFHNFDPQSMTSYLIFLHKPLTSYWLLWYWPNGCKPSIHRNFDTQIACRRCSEHVQLLICECHLIQIQFILWIILNFSIQNKLLVNLLIYCKFKNRILLNLCQKHKNG